jgi:two-component system chemotaxis response regulator CheY
MVDRGPLAYRTSHCEPATYCVPKTILVVDDSASARLIVGGTLRNGGYEVIDAVGGKEALLYARDHRVDLVLADLHMPSMDGITLIKELRALPAYRLIPILLLTTESSPMHKLRAKQSGATGWIVKPFKPAQLLSTLGRVFGLPHKQT